MGDTGAVARVSWNNPFTSRAWSPDPQAGDEAFDVREISPAFSNELLGNRAVRIGVGRGRQPFERVEHPELAGR
jgi:hypothetical protein